MKIKHNIILYMALMFLVLCVSSTSSISQEFKIDNKSSSIIALKAIYENQSSTYFLNCTYNKDIKINKDSCAFKDDIDDIRNSYDIQWMPIVSYQRMGRHLSCWKNAETRVFNNSPENVCMKESEIFSTMMFDMHNIVPVIKGVYQKFYGYDFGRIEDKKYIYNGIRFNANKNAIFPEDKIRGEIARVYFYMSFEYSVRLTEREVKTFSLWNNLYPPSHWEIWKNSAIRSVQGTDNPFISNYKELKSNTNR